MDNFAKLVATSVEGMTNDEKNNCCIMECPVVMSSSHCFYIKDLNQLIKNGIIVVLSKNLIGKMFTQSILEAHSQV